MSKETQIYKNTKSILLKKYKKPNLAMKNCFTNQSQISKKITPNFFSIHQSNNKKPQIDQNNDIRQRKKSYLIQSQKRLNKFILSQNLEDELYVDKINLLNQQNQLLQHKWKKQKDFLSQDFEKFELNKKIPTKKSNSRLWNQFQSKLIKKQQQSEYNKGQQSQLYQRKHLAFKLQLVQIILEQNQTKISQIEQKINLMKNNTLRSSYLYSHQLHEKYMDAKKKIQQHNVQYQNFLNKLKQQDKQRNQMLFSRRKLSINQHQQSKSQSNKKLFGLKYIMGDFNPSQQKNIRQVIQKKSKLNLQLDLSFQVQQRKRIAKCKENFRQNKNKLLKQKQNIQTRIKQTKQKAQLKEKELQQLQQQKQGLQEQRSIFLKMILKNSLDINNGAIWIFKKMIQYDIKPEKQDFFDQLGQQGKIFLLDEFNKLKSQSIFKVKPIKRKRKDLFKKQVRQNRQRVKSMSWINKEDKQKPLDFQSYNYSLKQQNGLFTFGSKLTKNQGLIPSVRKKSGSVIIEKTYEHSLQAVRQSKDQVTTNTFSSIVKEKSAKKIYQSTKDYLKSWINQQGWRSFTARTVGQPVSNKISQEFLQDQKFRVKKRFFKIGKSNTKYKTVLKTLYGDSQSQLTSRKVKTSRQ